MGAISAFSILLGALCLLLLLSMGMFPERWAKMLADAGRDTGRPRWSWPVITGSLLGILLLWYLHFSQGGTWSLAMAVLGTFLLGRMAQALLARKGLRQAVPALLQGRAGTTLVPYAVVAIALIVLSML
jgi:hypothetical protein